MKKDSKNKTVLGTDRFSLRFRSIALALSMAILPMGLTGCLEDEDKNKDQGTVEMVHNDTGMHQQVFHEAEEIANLGDNRDGKLVQGRDACIQELEKTGKSFDEATKACDEMTAAAIAEYKKTNPEFAAANAAAAPQGGSAAGMPAGTGSSSTVQHHYHSDPMNSFLFWYMVSSSMNRPTYVYHGSPSTGLSYMGGPATTTGAGVPHTAPPAKITPNQASYLSSAPGAQRAAVAQQIAAKPGVKVIPVTRSVAGTAPKAGVVGGGSSVGSHGGSSAPKVATPAPAPRPPSVTSHGGAGGHGAPGAS